jgi:hypothetical protein
MPPKAKKEEDPAVAEITTAVRRCAIKPRKAVGAVAAPQGPVPVWPPAQPRPVPTTLGEEVEQALEEWYGSRGLPIPLEEVGLAAKIDAAEAARFAEEARIARVIAGEEPEVPLGPGGEETLEGKAARLRALVGAKPEFGSDAFWAWARRKKAADNAELEAKGLPPLPTAKEKAAAAAAKKAATAEKKAAKAAAKK